MGMRTPTLFMSVSRPIHHVLADVPADSIQRQLCELVLKYTENTVRSSTDVVL